MNENNHASVFNNEESVIITAKRYQELLQAEMELRIVYALMKTMESYNIRAAVNDFKSNLHGTGDKEEANAE